MLARLREKTPKGHHWPLSARGERQIRLAQPLTAHLNPTYSTPQSVISTTFKGTSPRSVSPVCESVVSQLPLRVSRACLGK